MPEIEFAKEDDAKPVSNDDEDMPVSEEDDEDMPSLETTEDSEVKPGLNEVVGW